MCILISLFFCGGWFAPVAVLQVPVWLGFKISIFAFCFVWMRATYPRLRYECEVGKRLGVSYFLPGDIGFIGSSLKSKELELSTSKFKVLYSVGKQTPKSRGSVSQAHSVNNPVWVKNLKYSLIIGWKKGNSASRYKFARYWVRLVGMTNAHTYSLRGRCIGVLLLARTTLSSYAAKVGCSRMKRVWKAWDCVGLNKGLGGLFIRILVISCLSRSKRFYSDSIANRDSLADRTHGSWKWVEKGLYKDFLNLGSSWSDKVSALPCNSLINGRAGVVVFKGACLVHLGKLSLFYLLPKLEKVDGKFRRLLRDIVSNSWFLSVSHGLVVGELSNSFLQAGVGGTSFSALCSINFEEVGGQLKSGFYRWGYPQGLSSARVSGYVFSLTDNVVQYAVYLVLFAIYKSSLKTFRQSSREFCLTKSCHVALKVIKFGWHNVSWFIRFDLDSIFKSITRAALVACLKDHIQDEALFSLLHKLYSFRARCTSSFSAQSKFGISRGNSLHLLLIDICLAKLDDFVWGLKKKLAYSGNASTSLGRGIRAGVIKYVRCHRSAIIGICGTKNTALHVRGLVVNFLQTVFQATLDVKNFRLTNILQGYVEFLDMRIRWVLRKGSLRAKPLALEKLSRVQHRMQLRRSLVDKRLAKRFGDLFWKGIQRVANTSMRGKLFFGEGLSSARRKGIRKVASAYVAGDPCLSSSRQCLPTGALPNLRVWERVVSARLGLFFSNTAFTYILPAGFFRFISPDCPLSEQARRSFFKEALVFSLCGIGRRRFVSKDKLRKTLFLVGRTAQKAIGGTSANGVQNTAAAENQTRVRRAALSQTVSSLRPVIFADVLSIYTKLQEIGILKKNKKPGPWTKILPYCDSVILESFQSLACGLLSYYKCCDNLSRIKSIVNYYLRLSLVLTLKQKHKLSSSVSVFQKYGKCLTTHARFSREPSSFLTVHQVNSVKKEFLLRFQVVYPFKTSSKGVFAVLQDLSRLVPIICRELPT